MKRRLCHIFLLFAALIVLAPSCRRDRVRVIPRAKLAKIYAEMFMTDQWIQATPKLRTIADTSLVYEPILEAYGYTSEDYQYSVDHYMNDPERFSRILRATGEILDDRIKELQLKQAELARLEKLKNIADFVFPEMQLFLEDTPEDGLWNHSDSIDVAWDTIMNLYSIRRVARTDTIYEGVRMIVQADTLSVNDTLPASDTLAIADTLVAADTAVVTEKSSSAPLLKPSELKPTVMDTRSTKMVRDSVLRRDFQKNRQLAAPRVK